MVRSRRIGGLLWRWWVSKFTNPFTHAAELIDSGFSVQQALRKVSGSTMNDFYLEVAKGNVAGHSSINKFGSNIDIADGTEEPVWSGSGAYTFSTTADITHIVSSNTGDNGKVVEVQGLNASWEVIVQEKALGSPATTGVALTTPLIRVFRMRFLDAATNVGVVQCGVGAVTSAFTAGNLRAQMDAGNGQTLMAIYTVPAGKTAYMTKYYASIVGDPGPPARAPDYSIFRLYVADRANSYAPQLKHAVGGAMVGTSLVEHEFLPAGPATEKSDIYITAQPEGDIGSVSAGFDLVLVDDGF